MYFKISCFVENALSLQQFKNLYHKQESFHFGLHERCFNVC